MMLAVVDNHDVRPLTDLELRRVIGSLVVVLLEMRQRQN